MKGVRFMKKVLALVLCLMLLGSVAMADVVYNAPGEYPIANEIVTIKILAPPGRRIQPRGEPADPRA